MKFVEARDLSGPNLFGMEPLIKIEVELEDGESEQAISQVEQTMRELHASLDLPVPDIQRHTLDEERHVAITYPWEYETAALGIGRLAVELGRDALDEEQTSRLRAALERDIQQQNFPQWVRDSERTLPVVGITGTNGKTTTTRLLSHVLMSAGRRVGWSSSSGVYIQGECVLEGDYSGPGGARRVLREPGLDVAVLETARGGLLLRGLPYESNDVGIFLNVSADHLSLQGVEKIETLAKVKSVVVRATRPTGRVVLNADDSLVWSYRDAVRANVVAVTQAQDHPEVIAHIAAGGEAVFVRHRHIIYSLGGNEETIVALESLPYTYEGKAAFMVENVLAAAAGALALGLSTAQVGQGLQSFRSNSTLNPGRLNVYSCDGVTVVVDYAHNADGLEQLLRFGRTMIAAERSVHAVVGTAGDRRDDDFRDLGAIAARDADFVYLKDTPDYWRGRKPGEMPALMLEGVKGVGLIERLAGVYEREIDAARAALNSASNGDAVLIMCQSDSNQISQELTHRGAIEK